MSFPFGSKKGELRDWDVGGAQLWEASFCEKNFIHVSCIYLQLFYVEYTRSSVTISGLPKKAYLPLSYLLIFLRKIHYDLTFYYTVSFLSPLLECAFHASKDFFLFPVVPQVPALQKSIRQP